MKTPEELEKEFDSLDLSNLKDGWVIHKGIVRGHLVFSLMRPDFMVVEVAKTYSSDGNLEVVKKWLKNPNYIKGE